MHVDIWETDAWLGMLQGEKTFTLYHPAHRKFLEVGDNVWPDLLKPHNPARYKHRPAGDFSWIDSVLGAVVHVGVRLHANYYELLNL